jgi:hypothetical protein
MTMQHTTTGRTPVLDAPPAMTPGERRHLGSLERRINAGLQTFRDVGAALLEIRDKRLYRESHHSFEAYCAERWAINRSRAYQLIDSARVVKALGDPDDLRNEAQARELAPLNPKDAQKVWALVATRSEETGRPVTASLIRAVKGEVIEPNGGIVTRQTGTVRLVQDITRLVSAYQQWAASKPTRAEVREVTAAFRRLQALTG